MLKSKHIRMWCGSQGRLSLGIIHCRRVNVSSIAFNFHQALDQTCVFLWMSVGATWGEKKECTFSFSVLSFLTVMSTKIIGQLSYQ